MFTHTPRGVRPSGRGSAAALAAVSLIASGGVVLATPGAAGAASLPPRFAHSGQAFYRGVSAGSPADPSGPVVTRIGRLVRATHSSLSVNAPTISYGQSIVFQGRLTIGATQSPAANQALRLESSSGSGWQTVARSLADSGGSVTFTLKPTRSTKYRLAYAGVMTLSPSVSSVLAVIVKPHIVSAPKSSGSAHVAASVAVIGSHGNAGSAKAVAFLAAAEKQTGKKYVYGAAGPNAFDCSGLVMYVAAQFGLALPHHADSQLDYGKPVSAADAAPGDLIFFLDGGYAYHVGIYAGGHMMLDAPNSSTPVGLHTIWSSNVVFRRIF